MRCMAIGQEMRPIDVLPDDILLAIFDFCVDRNPFRRLVRAEMKKRDRGVAVTGARLSTMENPSFWIITSPEAATCLYCQNTCEGHARCMATLATCRSEP